MSSVPMEIAITLQKALEARQAVLTQNAAMSNIYGSKADTVVFSEYVHDQYSYVNTSTIIRNLQRGSLEHTGNPLHIAIQSSGYFAVQGEKGIRYTRSGAFMRNKDGALVTLNNEPVLSMDGQEIVLPTATNQVTIAPDGMIMDHDEAIAQIGVFGFANEQELIRVEHNNLKTTQEAIPLLEDVNVVQGALEMSNISQIRNLAEMVNVMQLYKINQRYIEELIKQDSKKTEQLAVLPTV